MESLFTELKNAEQESLSGGRNFDDRYWDCYRYYNDDYDRYYWECYPEGYNFRRNNHSGGGSGGGY